MEWNKRTAASRTAARRRMAVMTTAIAAILDAAKRIDLEQREHPGGCSLFN